MKFLASLFCLVILGIAQTAFAQLGTPGGFKNIQPRDVEQYKPHIEQLYNKHSKSDEYATVAKIESAKSQVIAGVRYVINFTLTKTDCKKSDVLSQKVHPSKCKPVKHIKNCVSDVIERAWEKFSEATEMKCDDVVTEYYKN